MSRESPMKWRLSAIGQTHTVCISRATAVRAANALTSQIWSSTIALRNRQAVDGRCKPGGGPP
jgi:hypothetical protein